MKKHSQQTDEDQGQNSDSNKAKRLSYVSFQRQSNPSAKRSSVRNIRDAFESAAKKNGDSTRFSRSDSVKSDSSDKKSDNCGESVSHNGVANKSPPVIKVSKIPVVSDKPRVSSSGANGITHIKKEELTGKRVFSDKKTPPNDDPRTLETHTEVVKPEKAQDRLAKSQSLIEQLQGNLATKLSPETVEAFKHDYSPALERRYNQSNEQGKFPSVAQSDSNLGNASYKQKKSVIKPVIETEDNTVKSKSRKLHFFNTIFGSPGTKSLQKGAGKDTGDVTKPGERQEPQRRTGGATVVSSPVENQTVELEIEKQTNQKSDYPEEQHIVDISNAPVSRDTNPPNSSVLLPGEEIKKFPKQDINRNSVEKLSIVESPPIPAKPTRVSWTTRLIQKLTEEETRKKNRTQPKVQKPRKIVRFPEKKPPRTERKDWPKYFFPIKNPQPEASPLEKQPETGPGSDLQESFRKESVSGVVLDDSRDAYACLIPQLVQEYQETESESEEQVSQVDGEDTLLKQKKLEEVRAAIAREECASTTSSDDDSVIAVRISPSNSIPAIMTSTGRKEEALKGNKPTGIKRLLPQNLFSSTRPDRQEDEAVLEPLLNKRGDRVYPAAPRPIVETAFLSDSESKLPMRQQGRSQSTSPASRHRQPSPKVRRHADQISVQQENEQNLSRVQPRSKSVSPSRERRSSATSPRRTIPDTSLVLEERLQHIRRELSSPPRSASATPMDRPNRIHQKQNSLPASPARTRTSIKASHQEQIYQNSGRNNNYPSDAYYHSPPSRRRQQNSVSSNQSEKIQDHQRKISVGSSASSTSTIVPESPNMPLSWNPLLLNLEHQAISGSPDIRKLQQHRQNRNVDGTVHYGEIRNPAAYRGDMASRNESPDIYYQSRIIGKPQGLLQVQDSSMFQQRNSPVPSGRLSAPPVPSYYIEDYPRRRVISPEPPRSRQDYAHIQPSRRSLSQPPQVRHLQQQNAPDPSIKHVSKDRPEILPVPAQMKITTTPPSRRSQQDNSKETQTVRSYIQQQQNRQLSSTPEGYSPQDKQQSTPPDPSQRQYEKLSRRQIEALYWETQKLRAGLSNLSQKLSPSALRSAEQQRYLSTGSLPQQLSPAQRNVPRSDQNSPMYPHEGQPYRSHSVQNIGGYGSLIVKPQPIYNNVQQYQNYQRSPQEVARAPRARSVSPGPNSNRHLSTRSLSLPRSMPAGMMNEEVYFSRGGPQRNTIGPIRSSQHSPQIRKQATPTIYEEPVQQSSGFEDVQLRHPDRYQRPSEVDRGIQAQRGDSKAAKSVRETGISRSGPAGESTKKSGSSKKNKKSIPEQETTPPCAPIFKRGSLISNSNSSVDADPSQYPMTPKRVSFTSSYVDGQPDPLYWPTRNGPAPEPPTRQRKNLRAESLDSEVFLPNSPFSPSEEYSTYANVPATMHPSKLEAPYRPLPPVPRDVNGASYGVVVRKSRDSKSPADGLPGGANRWQQLSESESGSEAGEVQRILQQGSSNRGTYFRFPEEEWGTDGKSRGASGTDQSASTVGRDDEVRRSGGGGGRSGRRDEPRRHTLSGDHHHHQQGGALARSMDLEMSSKSQRRKSPLPRGYPPPSSAMLFDDDPGIMSEVETSSTGFRRGGKQRSSLPVVRTPSKTLERPLGKTSASGAGVPIGVGPMLRISPHPSTHHHQMVPHHQLLNHHHHGLSNKQSSATATSGGLVFLQYRSETKRALLPNEITSIDTVKALFVRSFPKQLTMEYLDSPHVKIYIHDSSKDMFYELEDLRSHLRDIRDRSVLRLFESTDMNGGVLPGAGVGVVAPPMWDQDQSYFSEPEFDSEYQHQHIHKTKASSKSGSSGVPPQAPYYMTHSYPPGGTQGSSATLPRGGPLLRAYSPAVAPPVPADRMKTLPQTGVQAPPKPMRTYQQGAGSTTGGPQNQRYSHSFADSGTNVFSTKDRLHGESGYMSSPERGGPRAYPAAAYPPGGPGYEDPYYSQYASRSGSITPVIDEEASDTELIDESYSLYGVKLPTAGRSVVTPQPRGQFPAPAVVPYDTTRIRVEHMERQLANLTGLVQKALTQTPTPREYLQVPPPASARDANYRNDEYDKHSSSSSASLPDDSYLRTDTKPPKLGKDKSVSFEKSVSFSDEPPDMNSPKQHSPQHAADSKPPKPAIKSSTLPRMSSQERTERDRHKPAPPPKPVSLSPGQYEGRHVYRDLQLTPEMYNQLRGLQKKAKDLRQEVRNLRRMSQAQAHSVRETIRDTFMKIRAMLLIGGEEAWAIAGDADKVRLNREEDAYKQEMLRLEKDLTELESTVEELRGNVINRKTRVNMSDVENMALILSKSSKTVADLKVRFPGLQEGMKGLLSSEMEKVVREEKFLKEEPERLESALRRCKKLTGTLVTLKRLASVQEQRLPPSATPDLRLSPTMGLGGDSDTPITPPAHSKPGAIPARGVMAPTIGGDGSVSRQRPENALDALLDELQTFARPPSRAGGGHNPPMAEIGRKGSIDSAHPHAPSLPSSTGTSSLRRLHSYPSSSDGGGNSPPTLALARLQVSGSTGADAPKSPATSPKPPVPERNSELLSHLAGRRVPPPPPPRTSSRSPLASPTSPSLPPRGQHPPSQPQMGVGGGTLLRRGGPGRSSLREPLRGTPGISIPPSTATKQEESNQPQPGFNPASNSSSCESINSQEGLQQNKSATTTTTTTTTGNKARQEILEQRHQELLRKQRALQEQYARLQQLQRGGGGGLAVVPPPDLLLKKTGSESNLLAKMGLGHGLSAAAPISGSLTHLAAVAASANQQPLVIQPKPSTTTTSTTTNTAQTTASATTTTNKIYETDIL